ncbi:MAG TPA: protein kinase [Vicinamibacteria bacterium]
MIGQTISHYRVISELGTGGMGTVYRAEDLRLQRPVALKALATDLLDEPGELEAFKREARVAAALNHPGICTIHDVFEAEGRPFIVMELLEGRSLREELRGGSLPPERLLAIAVSVAEALEAAHSQRVIHRDMKPANVFVAPDGRHAKVLDFGLAELRGARSRAESSASGLVVETTPSVPTLTRVGAGTPAYVSPEQARGEPLDERTDLFSFGAVLYEMATGQRAFPGATAAAVFDAVINRAPASPSELNPGLPPELEPLILKLLEKDKALRYQTSGELALELRRIRRRTLGTSSLTLLLGATGTRRRLRVALRRALPRGLAVLLTGLALLALATLVLRRPAPSAALSERDFVLLAEFANRTGDPVFDLTLREALAVQLSQSPFLAIVPEDRVRETLRMMTRPPDEKLTRQVAREVCERLSAKAMLEGQIAALGKSYVMTLEATDCSAGESLAREQAQADTKEGVLQTLGKMATSMRGRLGESLATVRRFDVPIEQATTSSLDALKAYALGVAQRAKGDEIGAIPLLEHAVILDPDFASAHSALSAIYGSLGETDERSSHARLAYDNREHVTERERLFIEYQHHDAVGDERRAISTLEMWKQLYPRDYRAPNALAVALNRVGHYERAIEEALEAERRNPQHPFPRSNLAYAYRGASRFAEARRTAETAIAQHIETLPLRRLVYQLALIDGDAALADATLAWAKGRPREFDMLGAQAQAAAYTGELQRARPLFQRTAELARRQGLAQVALSYSAQAAWTESLYGNRREALGQAREVLRREPSAVPRLRAATALAFAGAPEEAERAIASAWGEESSDSFVALVYRPIATASVELAKAAPERALEALEPARPYELGNVAVLAPAFLRGLGLKRRGDAAAARREFEAVLEHRGVDPFSPLHALARLELARARAGSGDAAGARSDYDAFLALWAAADRELPVLQAARGERAALK